MFQKEDQINILSHINCGDCNCKEGQHHILGCDMEICPFCGGQLISCDCDFMDVFPPKRGSEAYHNLMNKLKGKRVPWIYYPMFCAKCGIKDPDFFNVPNEEWNKIIQPDKRNDVICKKCYDEIKNLIDTTPKNRSKRDPWGKDV